MKFTGDPMRKISSRLCDLRALAFLFVALPLACSSSTDGQAPGGSGGTTTSGGGNGATAGSKTDGGSTSPGGAITTGGALFTGGVGLGGTTASTGGNSSAGGTTAIGGTTATGGTTSTTSTAGWDAGRDNGQPPSDTPIAGKPDTSASTGGSTGGITTTGGAGATGGKTSTGGSVASGGTTSTGGATGGTVAGSTLCPPGITQTITVAKDGSGKFTTVQSAVDSIASGSSTHIRIDIKAGTYKEKLTIASRTNLCLVGADATTTILTYGDSNASTGGTATSASVHISANDFSAANLTFQNSYGSGSQAVALRATGQRQQYLNCRFVGYQDTLYTHNGSQYFKNCYVQGNTDYVFGGATAVLQNCEVRNVEGGSATTAPNTDAGTAYGIVFLGGKFTAASGVKANSVALARPWGAAGFAAFLNAELGSHIIAAGFVAMSGNPPQNARLHEYGSTGSGANASSRSSYQLSASQAAQYTLANIFGSWTPSYSQ